MKKILALVLGFLLLAAFMPAARAESGPEDMVFLSGSPFPVEYAAFPGGMPAFPTAERTEDGILIRGLTAWGVAPEALTNWSVSSIEIEPEELPDGLDPSEERLVMLSDWEQDPSVTYEDAVLVMTCISAEADLTAVNLALPAACGVYDEVWVVIGLSPDGDSYSPDGICWLELVKKPFRAECYPDGSCSCSRDFTKDFAYSFRAEYSPSGELTWLSYSEKASDSWFALQLHTDPVTGQKFYTSSTDPEKMPFELLSEEPVLIARSSIKPVSGSSVAEPEPNRMRALNRIPADRALRRRPPMAGLLPEELPKISVEFRDGKAFYTVTGLREWSAPPDLGITYASEDPKTAAKQQVESLDPVPEDQVRIVTDAENTYFVAGLPCGQQDVDYLGITGSVIEGDPSRIRFTVTVSLKSGQTVRAQQEPDQPLTWWLEYCTEDGLELSIKYTDGVLASYTAIDETGNPSYLWYVLYDGENQQYASVTRFRDDTGEYERYRLDPETGGWSTGTDEPVPCDPPEFLDLCPLLPITDG